MKIIALFPFKNEEWILESYIKSIKNLTDHIIAYDDASTDRSREILEKAGATVITANYTNVAYFAEFEIRQRLLDEGRKAGGTHFICLDADETFSKAFETSGKEIIASLKPGQSLWMDWITLYGDLKHERIDGVYDKLSKSFIFYDREDLEFAYVYIGVSRTPGDPQDRVVIKREQGAVLHFQYVNKERALVKRDWYLYSELIKGDRSAKRVNVTYYLNEQDIRARKLAPELDFEVADNFTESYHYVTDWRYKKILEWFDTYGISFFEPLDIWRNVNLMREFVRREHRKPKPAVMPRWVIKLNDLKNKIVFFVRYNKIYKEENKK